MHIRRNLDIYSAWFALPCNTLWTQLWNTAVLHDQCDLEQVTVKSLFFLFVCW